MRIIAHYSGPRETRCPKDDNDFYLFYLGNSVAHMLRAIEAGWGSPSMILQRPASIVANLSNAVTKPLGVNPTFFQQIARSHPHRIPGLRKRAN